MSTPSAALIQGLTEINDAMEFLILAAERLTHAAARARWDADYADDPRARQADIDSAETLREDARTLAGAAQALNRRRGVLTGGPHA